MTLGRTVAPKGAEAKLTGHGRFATDVDRPGLLHAAVLRSAVPHAEVEEIDVERAARGPGVAGVLTRRELGLDSRVRQYGDVIAAVAASTAEQAHQALAAIDYRLRELPSVHDPAAAMSGGPVLYSEHPDNVTCRMEVSYGTPAEVIAASEVRLDATYRSGRPTHCNLARHCCIAQASGDGAIEVLTSVDAPYFARSELAHALDLAEERVRIVLPELASSSFGGRSGISRLCEPIAARLALSLPGRPVRLEFEPEEEFVAGHTRHPVAIRVLAGATADGQLQALDVDVTADHGAFPNFVARIVLANCRDRPLDLYDLEHYRFRGRAVVTNNPDAGEMRGIGSTQISYALSCHMDELARLLGMDPLDFQRRNAVHSGQVLRATGRELGGVGLRECLERGAAAIGWHSRGTASTDLGDGRYRGVGLGVGTHTTGLGTFHGADVSNAVLRMDPGGTVDLMVAAPDSGQGSATIYAQIVAEEAGVPYEAVRSLPVDTATAPMDPWGSVASRGAFVVGAAVRDAARRLRERLRDGSQPPITVEGTSVSPTNPAGYGAYFAEVEVDSRTGEVRVVRVVAALDVGFVVNPQQCRGQIEGAVAMGVELALGSDLALQAGIPHNASFLDYRLASTLDVPTVEVELIESHEPTGPYGLKGVGTPAMTPILPAICNAIRSATGYRVTDVPIFPETIWSAMAAGGRAAGVEPGGGP